MGKRTLLPATALTQAVPPARTTARTSALTATLTAGLLTALPAATATAAPTAPVAPAAGSGLAGDFNGDGHTDLAAGNNSSPALNIFRGPIAHNGKAAALIGIDTIDQTGIHPDKLVAGEVNRDGRTDLLVMGMDVNNAVSPTRSVLYTGSPTGPKPGKRLAGGYAGVIADVDKDGYGDIVTGNFMETSASEPNGGTGGAVTVTYGAATGLSGRTPVRITQDTAGVPGANEKGDAFGWSLSAGDTTGDGYADIAVGVPEEWLGSKRDAGSVVVLRGSSAGLTGTGAKSFSQDTAGIPDTAESTDFFGDAVHLSDVTGDRRAELFIAARGENSGAGGVWSLRGTTAGPTATGAKSFSGTTLGGPSGVAYFGTVLGS
ncbi:FG-GAP and VCBS repeat-containing protein [Streptomyces sp. NPDC059477]|uniref:FG-GAP and VCBS repeat-containing protein n=1 Tax=Streptomyces sp. NPDC059477 TaxID=3346847 RepID=UPI003699032A